MTPDVAPSRPVRWLLVRLLGHAPAEAVVGDIAERLAARRHVRDPPRHPSLWCEVQALQYLCLALEMNARRSAGQASLLFRDGWRALRSSPSTSAFAVLILTLTIGVATVTFSVVDTVVLRQLPFEHSEELVVLAPQSSRAALAWMSPWELLAWRDHLAAFDSWAALAETSATISIDSQTTTIGAARVTSSLFSVLRTRPLLGRLFTPEDEQPGREPVAIIGYGLWQRLLGANAHVIGTRLALRSGPVTVIGVLQPNDGYPVPTGDHPTGLWLPYVMSDTARTQGTGPGGGLARSLHFVGRLKPHVTPAEASADMRTATHSLIQAYPSRYDDWSPTLVPLYESLVGQVRVWMLMALTAVVLLVGVACVNIANLLMTRSAARSRELAVRAALGATRRHLLLTLIVESLLLSGMAVGAALGLALWGISVSKAALPAGIARADLISLDGRVLAATVIAALVTGLAFGTAPAWQASRTDIIALLKDSVATVTSSRRRWRSVLVVLEVALASVLLVATTLFVTSFVSVVRANLGFDRTGLAVVSPSSPVTRPPADVMQALRTIPGVTAVAASDGGAPPLVQAAGLGGGETGWPLVRAGAPASTEGITAEVHRVTPDYFATAGIPLLRGTLFEPSATEGSELVLDADVAGRLFGTENPIGRQVSLPGGANLSTVVAIVGHVRSWGPEGPADPNFVFAYQAYAPLPLDWSRGVRFFVRLSRPVATERPLLDGAIGRFVTARAQPPEVQSLNEAFDRITAQRRFSASLMAIFGALALFIGSAGVYGVMTSLVAQQRRELAVRVALGASPLRIRNQVFRHTLSYLVGGLFVGLPAGWLLTRAFTAIFFGIAPTDVFVYLIVALAILTAGFVAAWPSARRAARVDPVVSLRTT